MVCPTEIFQAFGGSGNRLGESTEMTEVSATPEVDGFFLFFLKDLQGIFFYGVLWDYMD